MQCRIEIEMDNAAFEESSGIELARILRKAMNHLTHYFHKKTCSLQFCS